MIDWLLVRLRLVPPARWDDDRWQDRWFTGHRDFGRVTLYGANAMHWAINISTQRWGYICFHPPTRTFGGRWPWYFYLSPNATPWGATFAIGPDVTVDEKRAATWRRKHWGHGYSTAVFNPLYPLHPNEPMYKARPEVPDAD